MNAILRFQTNDTYNSYNKTCSSNKSKNSFNYSEYKCYNNNLNFNELNRLSAINKMSIIFTGVKKIENTYSRKTFDNYAGCILGGAIGDALGAPVEFESLDKIRKFYGQEGIQDLEMGPYGDCEFTDDTQMTIFTIDGLLKDAGKNFDPNRTPNIKSIYNSYKLWLNTQTQNGPSGDVKNGWISNLAGLYSKRAPGNTCLSALKSGKMGTIEEPINNSKGCGGIMRVAPVGLLYHQNPQVAFETGAKVAAITHGHPEGYLSAGMLSSIIAYIVQGENIDDAISKSVDILKSYDNHEGTLDIVNKAVSLAKTDLNSDKAIRELGWGWTGEEALAISLYCVLKCQGDFDKTITMAVNHDGDSDSTGAIAGNIAGALYGIKNINNKWVSKIEYSNTLKQMSKDLLEIDKSQDISQKYPYNRGTVPNWYCATPLSSTPRNLQHITFSKEDEEKMQSMNKEDKLAYKKQLIKDKKFDII